MNDPRSASPALPLPLPHGGAMAELRGLPRPSALDIPLSPDMVKGLPPKARAAVKMAEIARQAEQSRRDEEEKARVADLVGKEGLFRFGYVPFVIAKLAWDYADTVIDQSIIIRQHGTRKLARAIRELKRQYDNARFYYNEERYQDSETRNMYVYEEAVQGHIKLYVTNLRCDLQSRYPGLAPGHRELIVAAYQCHVMVEALLLYAAKQEAKMAKIVGHPVGRLIPRTVRDLGRLIMEFAGDRPASESFMRLEKKFVEVFANQMALIELSPDK